MTPDSPEQTSVSELARKAIRLMSQGGAMRIMDIPGDSSLSSHTFGGDVSRAVADLCRPDRSPAGEVRDDGSKEIAERDAMEEAFSAAYEIVMGREMEWISGYDTPEALSDMSERVAALSAAPAPEREGQGLGLRSDGTIELLQAEVKRLRAALAAYEENQK